MLGFWFEIQTEITQCRHDTAVHEKIPSDSQGLLSNWQSASGRRL